MSHSPNIQSLPVHNSEVYVVQGLRFDVKEACKKNKSVLATICKQDTIVSVKIVVAVIQQNNGRSLLVAIGDSETEHSSILEQALVARGLTSESLLSKGGETIKFRTESGSFNIDTPTSTTLGGYGIPTDSAASIRSNVVDVLKSLVTELG